MARFYVRPCSFKNCKVKKAYYGTSNPNDGWWCFIHKKKGMKKIAKSVCQYKDCDKRWMYAINRTTTKRFCGIKGHRKKGMIDLLSKMCILCDKRRASYAKKGQSVKEYCKPCANENNIKVVITGVRLCKCPKDKRQPIYNYPGKKIPLYCSKCKKDGMMNVKDPKCIICEETRPNYGIDGTNKKLYCKECSETINGYIVLIGIKMCETCGKFQATYGNKSDGIRRFCTDHKKTGMTLIYGNYCIKCENTIAVFGFPNDKKATYCKDDMKKGMIDIVNKRCITCVDEKEETPKQGKYNSLGEKCGKYCLEHKLDGMINVNATYCISKCGTQVSNNKYSGYCVDCYRCKYPNNKIFRIICVKEKTYVKFDKSMTMICSSHGEFNLLPKSHLQGSGCRKCGIHGRGIKVSVDTSKTSLSESDMDFIITRLEKKMEVLESKK